MPQKRLSKASATVKKVHKQVKFLKHEDDQKKNKASSPTESSAPEFEMDFDDSIEFETIDFETLPISTTVPVPVAGVSMPDISAASAPPAEPKKDAYSEVKAFLETPAAISPLPNTPSSHPKKPPKPSTSGKRGKKQSTPATIVSDITLRPPHPAPLVITAVPIQSGGFKKSTKLKRKPRGRQPAYTPYSRRKTGVTITPWMLPIASTSTAAPAPTSSAPMPTPSSTTLIRAAPTSIRAALTPIRAAPTSIRAAPTSIRAAPTSIRAAPTSTSSAPMPPQPTPQSYVAADSDEEMPLTQERNFFQIIADYKGTFAAFTLKFEAARVEAKKNVELQRSVKKGEERITQERREYRIRSAAREAEEKKEIETLKKKMETLQKNMEASKKENDSKHRDFDESWRKNQTVMDASALMESDRALKESRAEVEKYKKPLKIFADMCLSGLKDVSSGDEFE